METWLVLITVVDCFLEFQDTNFSFIISVDLYPPQHLDQVGVNVSSVCDESQKSPAASHTVADLWDSR